jgi:hypothetical protein
MTSAIPNGYSGVLQRSERNIATEIGEIVENRYVRRARRQKFQQEFDHATGSSDGLPSVTNLRIYSDLLSASSRRI